MSDCNETIINHYNEILKDISELIDFADSRDHSIKLLIQVAARRGVICYRMTMLKVVYGYEVYKTFFHETTNELMEKLDGCIDRIVSGVSTPTAPPPPETS